MIDNLPLLDELFSGERIRLCRGHLFDLEATPKTPEFDFDRIEGMLLGLAIGDALGNTSESQTPADRFRRHGVTVTRVTVTRYESPRTLLRLAGAPNQADRT